MSIDKIKSEISRLKSEVPEISDGEGLDAADGLLESVLRHLEDRSQRTLADAESLLAHVSVVLTVRGQIALEPAKNLHE